MASLKLSPEALATETAKKALLASETSWVVQSQPQYTSSQETMAVARGEKECPLCQGSQEVDVVHVGEKTGIRQVGVLRTGKERCNFGSLCVTSCHCVMLKAFWKEFTQNVAIHDQYVTLKSLKPSIKCRLPTELQETNLKTVRENPASSYLMFGPAGSGKTTLSVGLYFAALMSWYQKRRNTHHLPKAVWRVSAKTLLDQFHSYAISRDNVSEDGKTTAAPAPVVTREKIVAAAQVGEKPRVFLSELDKIKPTKFRLDCLFEIIDALYECNGQVVIDTNMNPLQLAEFFGDTEERGPIFIRRITDEGGKVLNFYER